MVIPYEDKLYAGLRPSQLSGLALWLDAADTSTITSSGGAVSQWNDKSGNGLHFSQGTGAYQPTLAATGINNKNVLSFDGSDDYLEKSYSALLNPDSQTLFVVGAVKGGAGNYRSPITSRYDAGSSTQGYLIYAQNSNTWSLWTGDSDSTWSVTGNDRPSTLNEDFILASTTTNGSQSLYYNNTLCASTSYSYTKNATAQTRVGAGSDASPNYFFNGYIGEIILYNRVLTDDERAKVSQYLSLKWGVDIIYTPFNIGTMLTWYDIQDSTTYTTDESNYVSHIDNKLGSSLYDLDQATGALQPLLVSNGINGYPALYFNSDRLTGTTNIAITGNMTMVLVLIAENVTATVYVGYAVGETSATNVTWSGGISSSKPWQIFEYSLGYNVNVTSPTAISSGANIVGLLRNTAASPYGNITFEIVSNDVNDSSTVAYSPADPFGGTSTLPSLGAFNDGGSAFQGYVGEVIMYNKLLNTQQWDSLKTYLQNKWGIGI